MLYALCLVAVSALATPATAATPKPYQWTTAQAVAAINAQGDDIYMNEHFIEQDLDSVTCRGLSKAGPGRFVSFRCAAVFDGSRVNLFAKTRRAGGMCWSTASLAAVPKPCLAAGVRKRGTSSAAKSAMTATVGKRLFRCLAGGFGFYECVWQDGVTPKQGTVVFSPAPVVKVLS
jgi:hypothetical protein